MPTTEGYNGAYTGEQIDAGIAKANSAVQPDGSVAMTGALNMGGQKLTNVGAPAAATDAVRQQDLEAVSQEVDHILDGTTPAYIPPATTAKIGGVIVGDGLSVDGDGNLSADKQIFWVNITGSDPNNLQADKTFDEILSAYEAGSAVFAKEQYGTIYMLAKMENERTAIFMALKSSGSGLFQLVLLGIIEDNTCQKIHWGIKLPSLNGRDAGKIFVATIDNGNPFIGLATPLEVLSDFGEPGTPGQVLTATATGTAWQDPPSGLPSGGTPGQMLYQGESGAEWGDKPVMYAHVTKSGGTYSADKTFEEIQAAYNAGYAIFALVLDEVLIPLSNIYGNTAQFYGLNTIGFGLRVIITQVGLGSDTVTLVQEKISADIVEFAPGTTGLTSTNVQDAIEEVAGKGSTGGAIYVNTFARASSWHSVEGEKYQIEIDVRNSISQELYHELLIADDRDLLIVVTPDPADLVGVEDFNKYGIYYYMRSGGTTFSLRAKSQPTYNIGILINIIRRTEATST